MCYYLKYLGLTVLWVAFWIAQMVLFKDNL